MHNSALVGVGTYPEKVQLIAFVLECQMASLPMRYLGLQLGGRLKDIQSWSHVMDLVRSKLESCQSRFLLMGGWVVLI